MAVEEEVEEDVDVHPGLELEVEPVGEKEEKAKIISILTIKCAYLKFKLIYHKINVILYYYHYLYIYSIIYLFLVAFYLNVLLKIITGAGGEGATGGCGMLGGNPPPDIRGQFSAVGCGCRLSLLFGKVLFLFDLSCCSLPKQLTGIVKYYF